MVYRSPSRPARIRALVWSKVAQELKAFRGLQELSPLTLDTLHGSMWGLNHRYKTLSQAMEEDSQRILDYSLQRIQDLMEEEDFTFIQRPSSRCRIGFGTYGWKYGPEVIRIAIEHGCLIDTAEGYGYGRVEDSLGQLLTGSEEVATKVRRDHMSPEAIKNAVTRSRRKLGLIPHVQLHFPNNDYPMAIKSLSILRSRGYVRSIGLGNCSVDMVESAQRFLSDYSGDVIRSVQVRYNLSDRRIEGALLPYCRKRGILVLAYSPLGQDFRQFMRPALEQVAEKHECSPAAIALAWILMHKGIMPIPRTNNPKHLLANLRAEDIELDSIDMQKLEHAFQ